MFKQIDNEIYGFENQIGFLMESERFSSKNNKMDSNQNLMNEINNLSILINKLSCNYLVKEDYNGNIEQQDDKKYGLLSNLKLTNLKPTVSRKHSLLSPNLLKKNRKISDE